MLLALLLLAGGPPADPNNTYNGRLGGLAVALPRQEASAEVDGRLDEPVWERAALLTGFSQFAPVDGIPAADSTEILVWYSPTAIYFGIRAFEAHGGVHATLPERDRIDADDYVQIFLSTFNDGRQAALFGVNPFGVQQDGVLIETGRIATGGFNTATVVRETPDLKPDYVFDSKGRLVAGGYEIEIRIPFKSLRFQQAATQTWGINILRHVQHDGAEESWFPAHRASATFLGQVGTLEGLTGLRRGVVLDVTPELTARADGSRGASGWGYERGGPELGGTLRWGVSNNLTLSGTAKPDFSQVESDAGQLISDPRQALFFEEKRPFFLEGIEQFDTPNSLIYTRCIVQPVAAAKLTGKSSGTEIAYLAAVDDRAASATGADNPIFNLLRLQRDFGSNSRLGMAYTDRIDGSDYNRVAEIDGRVVWGGIYGAAFQAGASRTRTGGATTSAPIWTARLNRSGRTFGFRYVLGGIAEDFVAGSGFISRPGVVQATLDHSVTAYGRPKALLQRFTGDVALYGTWKYREFVHGNGSQDRKMHFNANAVLRGGWHAGASVLVETFGYDQDLYADYALQVPGPGGVGLDTVPFRGQPRIPNLDYLVSLDSPEFAHFSASAFWLWGRDENFYEWASADIVYGQFSATWRPTDQLRVEGSYLLQWYHRRTDGSRVGIGEIPRLKVEYQIARPLFVRLIGEYHSERQDSLRDDSRTNAPILIRNPATGSYQRAVAREDNSLRLDGLVSYQPVPGTVLFAGYGSLLQEPRAYRFSALRRSSDGFFVKLSYLFRM